MENLINDKIRVKVSSVLNNNTTDNGKQLMFDGEEDTCWNSAQGQAQYIFICFDGVCSIKQIELTAQGGFCPKV